MPDFLNPMISAAAGLGGVFLGGWLSHRLESHKMKLKKSEFLFQREFEASSQFLSMRRRLLPPHRFREMVWCDVCEEFAHDFEKMEKELKEYMVTHGAALSRRALDRLSNAIEQTASGKFEVSGDTVSGQGIDIADKVMKELEAVENELHESVWSQSRT